MPPILFAVETAISRSPPLNDQRLLNWFTERQPQEAKSPIPLFARPGITPFSTLGNGPVRGGLTMNDVAYVVSGNNLYSMNAGGGATLLGSGIGGSGLVGMAQNGVQVCIVNGVNGYIYQLSSNTLAPIVSAAFYPANTVSFFDGYFVFDRIGTNEFFLSALFDGTTFNGLDFASAESESDIIAGTAQNLQLQFIFCHNHIELWYDAGTADFPFQRYAGGVINYGTMSPYSIVRQDGAIFFLGTDKVFYRLQANFPVRVSTHSIETIIDAETDLADCFVVTYTTQGHKFLALTLPTLMRTLVYDISTNRWHEADSVDTNLISYGRWRANCHFAAYGKVFVGDYLTGQVGVLDWNNNREFGNQIRCEAYSAPLHKDRKRIFVNSLELDVETGVGLTSGQGSDPQMVLSASKDGGRTFVPLTYGRSLGKQGKYLTRLRWLRQGNARQWTWKITCTDPVRRTVIAANVETEIGM